jgi:hypothetical protein
VMSLDWAMDGVHGQDPSLANLDVIEEEFHWEKMIARQKTKGRRKLLNLKSSINYGDASEPSRRWKGKAHMSEYCVPFVGLEVFGFKRLGPCGFVWVFFFFFVGWFGCSCVLRAP